MTSKQGEIPTFMVALLIGLVVLFAAALLIGKIPRTFQDVQDIEKELTTQFNSFKNGTTSQTPEDVDFMKSYHTFVTDYTTCLQSSSSDCLCKSTLPSQQGYFMSFQSDAQGFFVYPFSLKDGKKLLLDDFSLLASRSTHLPKGYCLSSYLGFGSQNAQNTYAYTPAFELLFKEGDQTVFSAPDKEIPTKRIDSTLLGLSSEITYFYIYTSGKPIYFYKPTSQDLCLVKPGSLVFPTYSQKKLCDGSDQA